MSQAASINVPFTTENMIKCMCPECGVQSESKCVSDKMSKLNDALNSNPLEREDIPGEYCSTGTATCQDIDTGQACTCFDCPVYIEYKLDGGEPTCYYCQSGRAR